MNFLYSQIHQGAAVGDDEPVALQTRHASITSTLPSQRQKTRGVFLFAMTVILLFADQNLMAPNLTAMAHDFGFTETQRDTKLGGDIALAFFVLGAPASYVVGVMADSSWIPRVRLFAAVVGLGEGACAMTFLTSNYWQLYICRAITGFSLGGALPLIYSILGDLYPAEQRHMVSSLVGIGAGIGIAFGQGVAGFLGPTFGWRLPFLVVSIPALICAILVLSTVDEPERGGMELAVRACQQPCAADDEDVESRPIQPLNESQIDDIDRKSCASELLSAVELPPLDGESDSEVINHRDEREGGADQLESSCGRNELDSSADSHLHRMGNGQLLVDETPDYYQMVEGDDHCSAFQTLLRTPTVALALLQGGPGCIPWGIVNTYLNDYLSVNRGMSVEVSSALAANSFGVPLSIF